MSDHPTDQIPHYTAGTLTVDQHQSIERHLSTCPACRSEFKVWQHIASGVVSLAHEHTTPLPPISFVLRASLHSRPTALQALHSAAHLIWAQRVVIFRSGILPATALVVVLATFSALVMPEGNALYPLLAAIPILGVVITALLSGAEGDSAYELVASTPTHPETLIYARISLALGTLILLAFAGTIILSIFSHTTLLGGIAVWLAPLLLLSSLTTVLALVWSPLPAAATALGLWWGILLLLAHQRSLAPEIHFAGPSLAPLLHPGPWLVGIQLLLALLMWIAGWILVAHEKHSSGFQEKGQ
jgi:hypothetical protein